MTFALNSGSRFRFGGFSFDAEERQLYHGSERVELNPKEIELLSILVRAAPRPLSKHAIMEMVWPNESPTDAALSQTIYRLRSRLAFFEPGRSYINTVSKFGFQLVPAPETALREDLPGEPFQWFTQGMFDGYAWCRLLYRREVRRCAYAFGASAIFGEAQPRRRA